MTRRWRVGLGVAAAVAAAVAVAGSAVGGGKPNGSFDATAWTTVLRSTLPIEGLTGDDSGNLYVAARGGAAGCPVYRVDANGPANQTPAVVGSVMPPCSPSGLTFDSSGRLYITGVGAAGDAIAVLTPNAAAPPVATIFATGTPGANGLAFDRDGNLYASDGGTNQGRVFRVGPAGGVATILFRVPPMANSVGVGRQNATLQPPLTPTRRAARCGASSSTETETSSAQPAAMRRSRATRSASRTCSCSTRSWTAPTGSRSTARGGCGWTRTSATRSWSSIARAA